MDLRRFGYGGKILSFEPLPTAYRELASAAAADPDWMTWNLGFGDCAGRFEINVAANSQSSSLLPMEARHAAVAPHARYVRREPVAIDTLDSFFDSFGSPGDRSFLKIDAQGYERRVLAGGRRLLPSLVGLQLELSLVPLYSGEASFEELVGEVYAAGFRLTSVEGGLTDPRTGQQLQIDGIFFRDHVLSNDGTRDLHGADGTR